MLPSWLLSGVPIGILICLYFKSLFILFFVQNVYFLEDGCDTDESAQLSLKSDLAVALFFSLPWSQPGFPIKPRRERDFLAHLKYLSQGLRLLCQTHSLLALTQAILDLSLSSIHQQRWDRQQKEERDMSSPERGFNLDFRLDPWPRLAIYNSYNRAWLLGRAYSDWHRGFWTSTPKRALISLATSSCLALRLENEKDTTSAGPGPLHTRTGSSLRMTSYITPCPLGKPKRACFWTSLVLCSLLAFLFLLFAKSLSCSGFLGTKLVSFGPPIEG